MNVKVNLQIIFSVLLTGLCLVNSAVALPFNDDMVDNQVTTGQIMRPQPKGSIAKGSLDYKVDSKEEAQKLTNPVPLTKESVLRGERLFEVNCGACHGGIGKVHQPSVAGPMLGAPNVADPLYHDRTDGSMFSTIHFGNIIMYPVGWKLSNAETWDIINYIRNAQQEKVSLED